MTHPRITCMTCGRALTPGGPVCCPKPLADAAAVLRDHRGPGGDPMSTPTPSIPGVDRDALADTIAKDQKINLWSAHTVADAALAHLAAHHECTCDREHADEWVEFDDRIWANLPNGLRVSQKWMKGNINGARRFVHRDDLPDPDDPRALIARELGPGRADTLLGLLDEHGWTVTRKVTR